MKKNIVWTGLLLLTLACATHAPAPAPVPDPPVVIPVIEYVAVACVVFDEHTNGPLRGALCEIDGQVAVTNADGYALFEHVEKKPQRMKVSRDGYNPADSGEMLFITNTDLKVLLRRSITPLPTKRAFVERYQGDFGNAKLAGCGFHNDSVFDPVVLLVSWVHNTPCFEQVLAAKAARCDTIVKVDPRADYRGQTGVIDLWHEPARFAAYLADIRAHINRCGEGFEVVLFLSGDGHIDTFLKAEGVPDREAEAHFARDVTALAAAARDQIAATTVCWECRHQRNYMTPGTYERLSELVARLLPQAWHGVHLRPGSSSVSSWDCGDAQDPRCHAEGDDPFQGSEPGFWARCTARGYCDGILYQFAADGPYLEPERFPNYTTEQGRKGGPGALGRWFEITARLCNDPTSAATTDDPSRHGWVQVDCIADEFIYNGYHTPPGLALVGTQSPQAYAIAWCQRALAIGGWGCGSASWRRPQ